MFYSYFLATAINHTALQRRQVPVSLLCRSSTEMGNNLPIGNQYQLERPSTGSQPGRRLLCVPPVRAGGSFGLDLLAWQSEKVLHLVQNQREDSHLPWLLSGQRKMVISVPASWSMLWVSVLETCTGITNCMGEIQRFFCLIIVIQGMTGRKQFMLSTMISKVCR